MMKRKIYVLIVILFSAFIPDTYAQSIPDYPELKNFSPLGVNFQGVLFNPIHSTYSFVVDNWDYLDYWEKPAPIFDITSSRPFGYIIGFDYTFNRANRLSFIVNASINLIPELGNRHKGYRVNNDFDRLKLNGWERLTGMSFALSMQYRHKISDSFYLNGKGGIKILTFSGYSGVEHKDVYSQRTRKSYLLTVSMYSQHWNPSIILGLGTGYNCRIAFIDLYLTGSLNCGKLFKGTYTSVRSDESVTYGAEQSGNYWGLELAIHPKKFLRKKSNGFII